MFLIEDLKGSGSEGLNTCIIQKNLEAELEGSRIMCHGDLCVSGNSYEKEME